MEPSDCEYDCHCTEKYNEPLLHSYQVTYTNPDMIRIREVIEADEVFSEGDTVEFWRNGIALLILQVDAIQQVRNISALDMKS